MIYIVLTPDAPARYFDSTTLAHDYIGAMDAQYLEHMSELWGTNGVERERPLLSWRVVRLHADKPNRKALPKWAR